MHRNTCVNIFRSPNSLEIFGVHVSSTWTGKLSPNRSPRGDKPRCLRHEAIVLCSPSRRSRMRRYARQRRRFSAQRNWVAFPASARQHTITIDGLPRHIEVIEQEPGANKGRHRQRPHKTSGSRPLRSLNEEEKVCT